MGLSTERKVFVALVGVAGLVLVIDRGLLGPGDAAAAAPQAGVGDASAAAAAPAPSAASIKPAAAVLIERLRSRVNPGGDAHASLGASFSLASLIESGGSGIDLSALEQPSKGEASAPRAFVPPAASDLPTLSSVMPASNGGGAVLGGRLLMVGQTGPGGYKLLGVKARGVVVEKDGRRYSIEIPITGGS